MKKRVTLDRQGNPVVEVKNKDGIYERIVDTDALKKLNADDLSASTGITRATGFHRKVGRNPYDGASVADVKKLKKKSGLDYLRTLSEEIKKRRDDGK